MAGEWFAGLGQTIAGGIATGVTFGQVQAVNNWTVEGAKKVHDNSEKTWGADGVATLWVEAAPVIGYVASAVHAIAGDEQRAKSACSSSSRPTLVMGGAVGEFALGGARGGMAGGALGSTAGQEIKHAIDEEHRDPVGNLNEFDGVKFAQDTSMIVEGAMAGMRHGAARAIVEAYLKNSS